MLGREVVDSVVPRRVLIVTGSFAPTMIADMHRARHLAWELPKLGWSVEILCPDESFQPTSCIDEDSWRFFTPGATVHFAPKYYPRLFLAFGLRGIGWRALIPMVRAGGRLLREKPFDLVNISTAQFPLFLLGPAWQSRYRVPFILDIHDPCFRQDIAHPVWAQPSLKHRVASWLTKYVESIPARAAAGIISVSPAYLKTLRKRYGGTKPAWFGPGKNAVIPFAARSEDLDEALERIAPISADLKSPGRIIYVGAGGPIMMRAFTLLCHALANLRLTSPRLVERVRIDLYGTVLGWREGERQHLSDLARHWGLGYLISENPGRVSYRRSLELLLESDGALILGVDDPGYMPSKFFSYALSGKPLLASLRQGSPALAHLKNSPELGLSLWFAQSSEMPLAEATTVLSLFLEEVVARRIHDRRTTLEPFLAGAMARRHVALFNACLANCVPLP